MSVLGFLLWAAVVELFPVCVRLCDDVSRVPVLVPVPCGLILGVAVELTRWQDVILLSDVWVCMARL